MKISVINIEEIETYESALNAHLSLVFGESCRFTINNEFICAVIAKDESKIIATGFAYTRSMRQGSFNFKAGIIGGIAVNSNYRGEGLSKAVIQELDQNLASIGVSFSFLFAYEHNVYRSSGYSELTLPIRYFDVQQQNWNQFIYRGGMVKSYNCGQSLTDQIIEFNGCIY